MIADIIAYEGNSWIDKVIQRITKTKISHTSVMISKNSMIEAAKFGVEINPFSDRSCKYYILRCNELTEKQRKEIIYFLMNTVGKKYDFRLFLGIGLRKLFGLKTKWDDPKKYICIELIAEAYRSVGINLFPEISDYELIPQDVLNSNKLSIMSSL